MDRRRHRHLAAALLGLGLAAVLLPGPVAAEPVPATVDSCRVAAGDRSWFGRLFDRYLISRRNPGDELRGRAEATVDRYREYAGRPVEVVLVTQVKTFTPGIRRGMTRRANLLHRLAGPLQCTTRDGTIRRQLLFRAGQPLDPFTLADSELLLRSLPYIEDARIRVLPLAGPQRTVAVVVETRDSWPLGADGKAVSSDQYDLSLYTVNLLGTGLAWNNELVHRSGAAPAWGYRGRLNLPNPTGHFTDLSLDYEDSWRRLRRRVGVEKNLVHLGVRWLGGASLEGLDDRDNAGIPRDYVQEDLWVGRALRLGGKSRRAARTLLVPALSLRRTDYRRRPPVSLTENRTYHDGTLLLAGLSLVRVRDYRTSYFFEQGETEDIRAGWDIRLAGGYEDGEFQGRTGTWLDVGNIQVGARGGILAWRAAGGGYWRRGAFEEGVLDVTAFAASRLLVLGSHGLRWYVRTAYTRGFDRFAGDEISLGNRQGLRGLQDDVLTGGQRLVASLEGRLFTPWSLLGFRCMVLGYTDLGIIADQDASLVGQRVLNGVGLGVRLENPGLVLPPLQVRLGVRDAAQGPDTVVEIAFGPGRKLDNFLIPSVKPQPVAFR